jgi:hypothetical protein
MKLCRRLFQSSKQRSRATSQLEVYVASLAAAFEETYPDGSVYVETEFRVRSLAQGKYLLGGLEIEAFEPGKYMDKVTKLCEDVDKALKSNKPSRKEKTLAAVRALIRDSQQFVEMGNATYAQAFRKDKGFLAVVDMSRRQELVSRILPLLARLERKLEGLYGTGL